MVHLGNFDECINVRDVLWNNASVFHGQYCLATITLKKRQPVMFQAIGGQQTPINLKIATCVPSSCNTEDTAMLVKGNLKEFDSLVGQIGMETVVSVNKLDCYSKEQRQLMTEDWIAVGVLFFFGALVVLSTTYDVLKQNSEFRRELWLAFSVYTNGRKLFAMSSSSDMLHCLHGIRFLSMCWVVMGHRYFAGIMVPSINLVTFMKNFVPDWKKLAITNGTLSVDTFFLLSGLLVAYVFFRQVPNTKSFNVPLYFLHRYIRLTPALAIVMLMVATLWRYTGSGPLWNSGSGPQAQVCRDYWWTNMLYVQNYVDVSKMCLSQGWYLAVDMQLFWCSPLVLIPLWRWPRLGWIFMAALMLGGAISNFTISYVNKFPGNFLAVVLNSADVSFFTDMYIPAYTRFMPYLIGVALGYILVDLQKKGSNMEFTKVVCLLFWLVGVGLMVLTLSVVHVFLQPGHKYESMGESLYNSLGRPGWALGVAIVIFLCATGNGGFINTILSWEWFQPLNRLCYSVYLVHMTLQASQYLSVRTLGYMDDLVLIPQFFADIIMSLLLSVVVCLVFESPFIILEKELLGKKKKMDQPTSLCRADARV